MKLLSLVSVIMTLATAMVIYNEADENNELISGPHLGYSLEQNLPDAMHKCLNDTEGRNTSVILQEGVYRVYATGDDVGEFIDNLMDCMEDIRDLSYQYSFTTAEDLVYRGFGEDLAREMLSEEQISEVTRQSYNLPPFTRYPLPDDADVISEPGNGSTTGVPDSNSTGSDMTSLERRAVHGLGKSRGRAKSDKQCTGKTNGKCEFKTGTCLSFTGSVGDSMGYDVDTGSKADLRAVVWQHHTCSNVGASENTPKHPGHKVWLRHDMHCLRESVASIWIQDGAHDPLPGLTEPRDKIQPQKNCVAYK